MSPDVPRKSVPAPQPTLPQRLREIISSPNAIRTASVAVFFVVWEYYGRRMDPIFMAPPSAIFEAALQLIASGVLKKALIQTLWPFSVGMVLTVVVGIALGKVAHAGVHPGSFHQCALRHPAHRAGPADHPVGRAGIRRQGHDPGVGRHLSHHGEH